MQKYYGVNELRKMFLDYFASQGHLARGSYSLVPHNDKSVLLIPAGMAPLKPYFTGQEVPPNRRMATCQKCVRTGDIENVGHTARHLTFFEMLGNFSFGDYFKHEAIAWSWEFLTKVVGLDENRLYPSIYLDDDEAFDIWNKEVGVPAEKIFRFGKEDNFWEHGAGPCGPCSEIYYDRGEKYGCGRPECTVGCDCDRYMEVWNNVFTQFDGDGHGNYVELANKNIDTGMGLERLAVVVQDVDSVFDIDTMRALSDEVGRIAGVQYPTGKKSDVSIRVIVDHIRSVTFMVSDGIMPSNEGRGYVLRRLLRRAARHGRLLGIQGKFLTKMAARVIETSRDGYPELEEKKALIFGVIEDEEEKFSRTIDQGLSILADLEKKMAEEGADTLSGTEAFRLYDTYGFPLDLTREILEEKGLKVDEEGFAAAMQKQKETARAARKGTNYMGADATVYLELPVEMTSSFNGYTELELSSEITALTADEIYKDDKNEDQRRPFEIVGLISEGDLGTVFTTVTPFYATMGGQKCDTGLITKPDGSVFVVEDTIKLQGEKIAHIGHVVKGSFGVNDTVTLSVDAARRGDTARNHSATHLLQKALRIVLGTHVEQAGSYVDNERLRFDFSHFAPLTSEELQKVETIVNDEIYASLPVRTDLMSQEEARKTGAMALFGEKYGEVVRVVSMGDFSRELCGGTHVDNTARIGCFKIVSEAGIAAGTRRIEALTGRGVLAYYAGVEQKLHAAAAQAKTSADGLEHRIGQLLEEVRSLGSENEKLKAKIAGASMGSIADKIKEIGGVKLIASRAEGLDMNGLRNMGDKLRDEIGEGVVVLASAVDGKVNLMVTATDGAVAKGAHAGNIIKAIAAEVGGGGGGRPQMAQAGGKNPAGIDRALEKAGEVLASLMKA
ncbi:MAG: alanine--tRNA ligase [Lachnospiraceae bacterium]|nr:alanine--tRNA ligase [Lachnospiraceae bacterium]